MKRRPISAPELFGDSPPATAPRAGVRPMAERIREIYRPPANVSIADRNATAPEARTVDAVELTARQDRAQARVLREWAESLEAAQRAGDWSTVGLVRAGLRASAVILEEGAGDAGRLSAALARAATDGAAGA